MPSISATGATLRETWLGIRVMELLARISQLELLDRSYTLAAQTFVALLPLLLVLSAMLTGDGESSIVAEEMIARFGLVGAAATAARELIAVRQQGVYWMGLVLTVYACLSLSRRASRAYNAVWKTPQLPIKQQWRGLVWIALQIVMIWLVTSLRGVVRDSGAALATALAVVIVLVWFGVEAFSQNLLTRGAIARGRLLLAAGFVTVGRLGLVVWGEVFLSQSLARQAVSYGPIGVVFGMFTSLLGIWLVYLGGTLLAAVLTDPDLERAPTTIVDVHSEGGQF